MTSRPRRDFLLDSDGVSALAASRDLLVSGAARAYLEDADDDQFKNVDG